MRINRLVCWTEVGAKYDGVFQSLLANCRLHEIDPCTNLVDVLQRVDGHAARAVAMLTPQMWKQQLAAARLRSVIDRPVDNAIS